MSFVISSLQPFPSISWWCHIIDADNVAWDVSEHFEKMSNRNRYSISTANGLQKLSIPLQGGRDQKSTMRNIKISYVQAWQTQHWRTLVSAYARSPYFEFYIPLLQKVFQTQVENLADFDLATIRWLKKQLKLNYEEERLSTYKTQYPEALYDLRKEKINAEPHTTGFPIYSQVFGDRTGFLPDLSLLDLLFAEGPQTVKWLKDNKEAIIGRD